MPGGFRLVLSDLPVKGGGVDQEIFRFEDAPLSLEQLRQLVQEKLFSKGLEHTQPLQFVGHSAGQRRVLKDDDGLFRLMRDPKVTAGAAPSIEVQLPERRKPSDQAARDKAKLDHVTELEQENATLKAQWARTAAQVDELLRLRKADLADNARIQAETWRHFKQSLDDMGRGVHARMDVMANDHAELGSNVGTCQSQCATLGQRVGELGDQVAGLMHELKNNTEDLMTELSKADVRAQGIEDSLREHLAHLRKHDKDLQKLGETKVDVGQYDNDQQSLAETVNELQREDKRQHDWITNLEADVNFRFPDLEKRAWEKIDTDVGQLRIDTTQWLADAEAKNRAEDAQIVEDSKQRDEELSATLQRKTDKLKVACDKNTRARERGEENQKLALGEVQRTLRLELSTAAGQIHEAIKNLNHKQEMTKAELSMTTERLNELKEQAQLQFSENALKQQAAQVHASEGLAAVTRLFNGLKDDHIRFKENMSGHVNMLQHENANNTDGTHALELERKRLLIDHQKLGQRYEQHVMHMDQWTSDVEVKMDQLYRAVQPNKVEWRLSKVGKKLKEFTTPMMIKSEPYSIAGLKGLRFDWYPNGYYGLPKNTTCVRFYAPAGANIQYECKVGGMSDGIKTWKSGVDSLWVDVLFMNWQGEVKQDCIVISFEIIANLSDDGGEPVGSSLKISTD
jgi:hypothetical protein